MLEAKNLDKEISIKKIDNETTNIKIFNNNVLMAIVGEFNKNLIQIEKLTNTKIFFRGNSITAKGNKNSISTVSNSLMFLVNKYLVTNSIENNDIIYSIKNEVSELKDKKQNNIRSIDLSYSQVKDLRFLTEMQNLEYVKLPSGSELSKELKSKEFTTEGHIAKLKMKILSL